MKRARLTLAMLLGLLALGGLVIGASAGNPYTFDGAPATPQSFAAPDLDIQIHSREPGTWPNASGLQPMTADHGTDCAAPPATHPLDGDYGSHVFQCGNHVMTSMNADGYGEIVLTPAELLDFSQGGTVSFDLSTLRESMRDWVDLWITPWSQNLTLPFDEGDVDLQGAPQSGVHIRMDQFNGQTVFRGYVNGTELADCWWCTIDQYLPNGESAAQRQTFRLTLSQTHVRFEMLASGTATGVVWVDADTAPLGFTQGVVQLAHHDYNPTKDGAGIPATWHWDNLSVSPAVPFAMDHAVGRDADPGSPMVTFDSPAPANAWLRFTAIGTVTVDGVPITRQVSSGHPEHMSSYFIPIAQGTQSVTLGFAADSWYAGPFIAQDFSIWAQQGSATPTATATVAPPTATPTRTPTTAPTPTRTPTPTPVVTYRCQRQSGNGSFTTVWTRAGGGSCP